MIASLAASQNWQRTLMGGSANLIFVGEISIKRKLKNKLVSEVDMEGFNPQNWGKIVKRWHISIFDFLCVGMKIRGWLKKICISYLGL